MRAFDLPGRSAIYAENGMAATSHPLATATAIDVLRSGGNAVDAAIAASAVLCVVEPHMTGIGGDCFAIVTEPDGKVHALNGSGRAPAGAHADAHRATGLTEIPEFGALAITVPGAVKAWEVLLDKLGTRGFDELFRPAIAYAEEGFAIHPRVARDWAMVADSLSRSEAAARHFLVDGAAPRVGARFRLPAFAQTLRKLAKGGAKAFYEGEIAAEIAATVQSGGGHLAEGDLVAVTADWVDPVCLEYGGHDLLEIPPNGQGITALILLGLMKRLDVRSHPHDSAERYHLEIEAGRLAYSVRNDMVGDPATMTASTAELLSDTYLGRLAGQIDPRRRNPDVLLPRTPDADTIYLTVVDRDRRAVSFINSVYEPFGSKIVTPKSAFALQNRGACFNLVPGHPNELGPRKRPMHTIIPAMAMRAGEAAISFGVMGGAYQPMGHAHVFANMMDFGMDPQQALDHPRLFWADDGVIEAEAGIPERVLSGLAEVGHRLRPAASPHGGGQVIAIDRESGFLIGGSDPRKDGLALGW